jgi:uncharacterized protein (UPF0371 family)
MEVKLKATIKLTEEEIKQAIIMCIDKFQNLDIVIDDVKLIQYKGQVVAKIEDAETRITKP